MYLNKRVCLLVGLLVIVSISASPIYEEDPCYVEYYEEPERNLLLGSRQPGDFEAKTIHERFPANQYIPDWVQILARGGHIFTKFEAINVGAPGNGQKISKRYGGPNCTSVWFDFHFNVTEDYFYDIRMWLRPISGNQIDEEPILIKYGN